MRDGYSDDGVKWDNVKLFLKTEEKPFNRVSGSDSRTWALAGSSRGNIFFSKRIKKTPDKPAFRAEKLMGLIRIKFTVHDLFKRPRT